MNRAWSAIYRTRGASLALGVCIGLAPAVMAQGEGSSLALRMERFESGLRPALRVRGQAPVRWGLKERMAHYGVPGVSVAIIDDGEIVAAKGFGLTRAGRDEPVDDRTVFSVGSVSKLGTALAAHALVREGVFDLDTDVNQYLKGWKIKPDPLAAGKAVTLRGLMSHTAGLNVHGFDDFLPEEPLPTVLEVLEGKGAAKSPPLMFIHAPGSVSDYSGGGTTVTGLAIADQTSMDFHEAAQTYLFQPLGMSRSTYEQPLPASHGNIAHAHDAEGQPNAEPRGWHSFPETAASGLWTTPTDTALMLIALRDSYHGEAGAFLSREHAQDVLTEVGPSRVGLGPFLRGSGATRRFGHEGSNESYKALAYLYLDSGKGAVIFTNGARGAALYGEMLRSLADAFEWPEGGETVIDPNTLQPKRVPEFVRTYALEPQDPRDKRESFGEMQSIEIVSRDGGIALALTLPLDGGGYRDVSYPLFPISRNEFVDEAGQRRFEFVLGTHGALEGVIVRYEGYAAFYKPADA